MYKAIILNVSSLHLFDAVGIELEYMLVDRDTLDVRPIADSLLAMIAGGQIVSDVEQGAITWSNELALHVVELKSTRPSPEPHLQVNEFQDAILRLEPTLNRLNARLLPTAMHPWMDPRRETMLWPHECHEIYRTYDQIFDCKRHGWANVQSVHLNLPFHGDQEFARLHAAVRVLLPILPALAASSPIVDGRLTGYADSRMQHYAEHCAVTPSLVGNLIPEPIYDERTYRSKILAPIGIEIEPLNAHGALELEFLNARGAIARFDRGSIELRVLDIQEYPQADVAICAAVTAVARALVHERTASLTTQQAMPTDLLRGILDRVILDADRAIIESPEYLSVLGIRSPRMTAGEVWQILLEEFVWHQEQHVALVAPLEFIQEHGPLATRIQAALGTRFDDQHLLDVYSQLAACLQHAEPFQP